MFLFESFCLLDYLEKQLVCLPRNSPSLNILLRMNGGRRDALKVVKDAFRAVGLGSKSFVSSNDEQAKRVLAGGALTVRGFSQHLVLMIKAFASVPSPERHPTL
jgi:hypothetical protein